ncbi:hypothetical protein [Dactylosporangium sp. CA-139066]|uniref:hypothetical protein n=1 Tax=Dactylosporangium sp. CA-139066 TaxID=3239930 RepID=UPI003D8E1B86
MPGDLGEPSIGRGRRWAALGTSAGGALGMPAGILLDDALVMLVALCVLGVSAGLWHPVR